MPGQLEYMYTSATQTVEFRYITVTMYACSYSVCLYIFIVAIYVYFNLIMQPNGNFLK